jgi:hypothetical protein
MKVIPKRSTTMLIKGHIYDVAFMRNSGSKSWRDTLRIESDGRVLPGHFRVSNFTDENGKDVPIITGEYSSKLYENLTQERNIEQTQTVTVGNPRWSSKTNIEIGEIVVCKYEGNTKYLAKGRKYKIVNFNEGKGSGSGKIKVDGLPHWLSPYRFRKLSTSESRDLSLSEIFGSAEFKEDYKVDKSSRRIDSYNDIEKLKILFHALSFSIGDNRRHAISIVDWASKITSKQGISKDDYKDLINLSISDILKKIDPNWNLLNFDEEKPKEKKERKQRKKKEITKI